MRAPGGAVGFIAVALGVWGCAAYGYEGSRAAGAEGRRSRVAVEVGSRLFQRKWIPNDPRCHGGDGLGPVYNASSCVACHNLGGLGGAGSNARNVELVAPVAPRPFREDSKGVAAARALSRRIQAATGLPAASSVVLHRFGSRPAYDEWRRWLLSNDFGAFSFRRSERNTPALFGAGLIDALPDSVIEQAAQKHHEEFPEIHGRVCRLKDGRIGRFGWKAQMPGLDDFVLTACSVELGLEVPGHHQSPDPSPRTRTKNQDAAELDLNEAECFALTTYIRSLPAPVEIEPTSRAANDRRIEGGALFRSIGCADCHTPSLGGIDGIYSDLLVHDMGPQNSDTGGYSSEPVDDAASRSVAEVADNANPDIDVPGGVGPNRRRPPGAARVEWRTPPLWGLPDSAPYMHNGSAMRLGQAIGLHGGEAEATAGRYARLSKSEQTSVRAFLMSLAAPKPSDARRPNPAP